MDLSGPWRAALADDDLRRGALGLDYDDDGWEAVPVPGHWRSTPAFAESDGPLLYRTRFELDAGPPGARQWVVLDGVFYQADVFLDGAYLGDPEGYFFPHSYEITDLARLAPEHVLAVEVACAQPQDRRAKRNLTGVFQHWDCMDPDWNPGGLWRGVRIERTGPVRINRMRVLCRDAEPERANVMVRAELDSDEARTVRIRTTVDDAVERELEQSLATGTNVVEWTFGVDNPRLWWPRALGEQPLSTLEVAVSVDHEPSHARSVRTGLRQVAMHRWVLSVNGERLFLKGVNAGPTRMALAEATPDELRRDVVLAAEAGLDLIRVHGHITRPELYEAADELGMLIWQDLPLQWGYARSVGKQAARQAAEAVDLLGHHPSVAIWCGHNEPLTLDVRPGEPVACTRTAIEFVSARSSRAGTARSSTPASSARWSAPTARARSLPTPASPPTSRSSTAPTATSTSAGTTARSVTCRPSRRGLAPHGPVRQRARRAGRAGRRRFMEPERWPDLDWGRLQEHHAPAKGGLRRAGAAGRPRHLRRLAAGDAALPGPPPPPPHRGVAPPEVPAGRRLLPLQPGRRHPRGHLVAARARPHAKLVYHVVAEACRPVIVVADRMPAGVAPGETLALDVHVVSDRREPIAAPPISGRPSWPGGDQGWRWRRDIPQTAASGSGPVQVVVPATSGRLVLDLDLVAGDDVVTNRYESLIS